MIDFKYDPPALPEPAQGIETNVMRILHLYPEGLCSKEISERSSCLRSSVRCSLQKLIRKNLVCYTEDMLFRATNPGDWRIE